MSFDPHEEPPAQRLDPRSVALDRDDTLLLVLDLQEKLAAAMEPSALAELVRNTTTLLRAAARLGIPIVATEQYPKGLGPTLAPIAALLPEPALEKLEFSVGNNKAIARSVLQTGRRQIIVVGMETHICVFQTARDLSRGGLHAFVPADAVLSRTEANCAVGLTLCERAGATVTSTEAVLFDLLGEAGTPEFAELAPLIR